LAVVKGIFQSRHFENINDSVESSSYLMDPNLIPFANVGFPAHMNPGICETHKPNIRRIIISTTIAYKRFQRSSILLIAYYFSGAHNNGLSLLKHALNSPSTYDLLST
jgi:hypothetical protein